MAKVVKGGHSDNPPRNKKNRSGEGANSLDTLAQLGKPTESKVSPSHNKFLNRAKRKSISKAITGKLLELHSPLWKSYWRTHDCIDTLLQEGGVVRGRYCKQRWCAVCSNIRTADAINGYKNVIQSIGRTNMVTLTFRAVKAEDLPEAIKMLSKAFRYITHDVIAKKHGIKFKGIRKLECNYNLKDDTYNPHLHLLCATERACELLLLKAEWCKYFPSDEDKTVKYAVNPEGQHIQPADENTFMEVFKYTSKPILKEGFSPAAQDMIYRAFRNVRTLQPIGIKKHKQVQADKLSEEIDFKPKRNEIWTFVPDTHDWVNASGETFTGYSPDDKVMKMLKTVKNS